MPVVKTQKDNIAGEEFTRRYNVNSHGTFTVKVPPVMAEALGIHKRTLTSKTLNDLIVQFDKAKAEFLATRKRDRKVISYISTVNYWKDWKARDDAHCHGVGCFVYVENEIATDHLDADGGVRRTSYRSMEEDRDMRDDDDEYESPYPKSARASKGFVFDSDKRVIDWTQEREDFFVRLTTNLEQLALAVADFADDETRLIEKIESGERLLEEKGKDPAPRSAGDNA